ncbi:MAG: DNA mismatch repair endonuclease MutL [Candidatus Izemoplasmatales bacterium]
MGIIKRLDPSIANKIAAGEVIEKLANVVKELVENSIDAEATKIDIDLLESGMKSIKVTDNGLGMDESDAFLAFERHATSKIMNVNDLFRIQSLGFRGEALPSIAAISRVDLSTSNGEEAINIIYEDGKFIEKKPGILNQGTAIEISKLFYSTPARFKYLKSPQTELAAIVNMVNGFALANPHISFRLTNDKKQIFVTSNNESLINIMSQIYGINVGKSLIYFEAKNRDYQISGYTTNPIVNRSSRNYINIVVNNRIIQSKEIVQAFLDAYDQLIPKNRYPVAIIYIEVDPILIDVNIHPRKQEIKFSEKDRLVNLIKRALKERLEVTHIYQKPKDDFSQTKISFYEDSPTFQESLELEIKEEESKEEKVIIPDMEYIGQYSGTYLLWQNEEALFLLDQHAAAERIRYEKYLKKWTESNQEIQELLTPLKVELANDILIKTHEHLKEISVLGVDLEIKDNYVLVKKIPLWFPKDYEELYVETIIQNLINDELVSQESMIDDLAKLLACKHSLKANHYISSLEANQLLNDLRKCKRPYTCPHGRPIIVDISLSKIEFWFNRVI